MEVTIILLGISLILIFGFLAEFIFKKTHIPDILFLIVLGFVLGPHVLDYLEPSTLQQFAPVFTTFALLFLIFDGAFNIDLNSIAKGVGRALLLTFATFTVSVLITTIIMYLFGFGVLHSILTGAILGGISSAFVIPLMKQVESKGETYFIMTFESALSDVLAIVFSLAMIEIIKLQVFDFQAVLGKIASLFAVAGLIGIVAGIIWIILVTKLFKEHKSYMITIAYVILVYVVTEFLFGNGAIAVLFLGLMLRNSYQLTSIVNGILVDKNKQEDTKQEPKGVAVITKTEEFFYSQISFFLKTFFFVYIGLLFNISNVNAVLIGLIISLGLMLVRNVSKLVTKKFSNYDKELTSSIFARGLAAAAIAQLLLISNIEYAQVMSTVIYSVIVFTILLSSIKIFILKKKFSHAATDK